MNPPHTVASLTEELRKLRAEQEHVTGLAVYVGMSKEVTLQYEERKERISEICAMLSTPGKIDPVV